MTFEIFLHVSIIGAFVALLALAAISDVCSYKITNKITLAIAVMYPVHVLAASSAIDWTGGLMVGGVVLAVSFVLFAFNVIGGGDAKMLAATALWAGPALIADFLVFSTLTGGVLSVLWLSPLRHGLAVTFDRFGGEASGTALLGAELPYGLAIAVGGVVVAYNLFGFGLGV